MAKIKYREDIQDFLKKAEEELKYIQWDLKGNLYPAVCFWSQQVAEKSLKALWLFYEKRPIKIHSIKTLVEGLEKIVPEIKNFRKKAIILDRFYIATRYPNGDLKESFSLADAQQAYGVAKEILDFVDKELRT